MSIHWKMSRRLACAAFALVLGGSVTAVALDDTKTAPKAAAKTGDVTIFAAASLKNAIDDINSAWNKATENSAKVSFAASSALAKQIEQGAPADIFISADQDWMNYVAEKKLIKPDTRADLLGNKLVIVGAKDAAPIEIKPGFDLGAALKGGRLAVGTVDAVPAGKYAKAALEKLGSWDGVKDKLAQAESVRAALLLVGRGEAPLGIVYQTDAAVDPNVKILGVFPDGLHAPIVYPVAAVATANAKAAEGYLAFLKSGAAKATFEKYGFTVLN